MASRKTAQLLISMFAVWGYAAKEFTWYCSKNKWKAVKTTIKLGNARVRHVDSSLNGIGKSYKWDCIQSKKLTVERMIFKNLTSSADDRRNRK